MTWYLSQMEQSLSEWDTRLLKAIFAPTVVGVPLEDARRSLCVMPDGEIRSYGSIHKKHVYDAGERTYLASRDCGLSWKLYFTEGKNALGASVRSPYSGKYITIQSTDHEGHKGTYVYSSTIGPSDCAPAMSKISEEVFHDIFQPVALSSRQRWVCTMHRIVDGHYNPIVMLSDDDGDSWRTQVLPSTPRHEPVWPHLGVRWQNSGAEPAITELPDGRLMLLARTSLDYFYVYYSEDGGDNWTDGEPSLFHSTLTTPYLLKLSDARNVLFWCNTQPLPELVHENQWPPLTQATIEGRWEDVFTNRDANHAAITTDGVNWTGFRELFLSVLRGDADYRTKGGKISSRDKSVHQFQALELPFGKILVAFGQHEVSRKMVIFDVNWLYETSRAEDFQTGLVNMSTHVFVKSISGSSASRGFAGHCAWNRTNGALLVPDPEATHGEVLQLARIRDPRLFSEVQGAVWNFPAAHNGELSIELRVAGSGVRLSLTDHWFNPIDVTVRDLAHYSFALAGDVLPRDTWCKVRIKYAANAGYAQVYLGDIPLFKVQQRFAAPCGLSYLHIQSLAETEDPHGTYIRAIRHEGSQVPDPVANTTMYGKFGAYR